MAVNKKQEHAERHKLLHRMLDELLADWIAHNRRASIYSSVFGLLEWSHQQSLEPDHHVPGENDERSDLAKHGLIEPTLSENLLLLEAWASVKGRSAEWYVGFDAQVVLFDNEAEVYAGPCLSRVADAIAEAARWVKENYASIEET